MNEFDRNPGTVPPVPDDPRPEQPGPVPPGVQDRKRGHLAMATATACGEYRGVVAHEIDQLDVDEPLMAYTPVPPGLGFREA